MTSNSGEPVLLKRNDALGDVTITQIAAGGYHSVALGADGNVYSWGDNLDGQLGDGTTSDSGEPVLLKRNAILGDVKITQVAAGYLHSVALGADGNVYSWGYNYYGQLGTGDPNNQDASAPVLSERGALPDQIVTLTQVAAGATHSVGLGSDGNVYSWGSNTYGQLGDGTTTNRTSPVLVQRGEIPVGYASPRSRSALNTRWR